jgi:hypothetical protein
VKGNCLGDLQPIEVVEAQNAGGNLQQSIGLRVEAACLDIDYDGKKTPEA